MRFSDGKLYVAGIGTATMTDPATGNVLYWTDKCREADVSFAASEAVLNAGLHNAPVMILPTSPDISVRVSAADYNEYVKADSVGAPLLYGAPVLTCQTVEALETTLTVETAGATPVAGLGMDSPMCYVQEVGKPSFLWADGTAYEIDPATGNVVGFTAEPGKQYFMSYWAVQANATLTVFSVPFRRKIVRFVLTRAIYTNYDARIGAGDFWGWLHEIIPYLQLSPEGAATNGSQTAYTMTDIVGRALTVSPKTVKANCGKCGYEKPVMLYRILQPCDPTAQIEGVLGAFGSIAVTNVGESILLRPAIVVNGQLAWSNPQSDFSYISEDSDIATVGANTGIVNGISAGETRIAVFYQINGKTFSDIINLTVLKSTGAELAYSYTDSTNTLLFDEGISGPISTYGYDAQDETLTVQ